MQRHIAGNNNNNYNNNNNNNNKFILCSDNIHNVQHRFT